MAREVELLSGRENAHAVVRLGVGGLLQERRLGEVGPRRNLLHLLATQTVRAADHGERVAGERASGEDVDFKVFQGSHPAKATNAKTPDPESGSGVVLCTPYGI